MFAKPRVKADRVPPYLPKDLSTEASSANRVPENDKRDNEIFLPGQIDDLLSHAPVRLIPGMAIAA